MNNPSTVNGTPDMAAQNTPTQNLSATAQQTAQDAKAQVQQTAQSMQAQARNAANAQMAQASQGLDQFAQSVRDFSQDLRGRDQAMMAEFTNRAADQIERVADYMQRDIGQMADDVSNYASRQPVVFLAGAFVLGFLGARFLKSSSNQGRAATPPMRNLNTAGYRYGGDMRDVTNTPTIGTLPTASGDLSAQYPPMSHDDAF